MYPAIGHFNASFVLNELLSRQHRIVYCVDEPEYEKIIYRQNRSVKQFYTAEENGLNKDWQGRVWLNPPFSNPLIQQFLTKIAEHNNGIALVFAKVEAKWFHDIVLRRATAIKFLYDRVRFYRPDGTQGLQPRNGSMLIAYGTENARILSDNALKSTRDYQNPYDPYAIKLFKEEKEIGFVPREYSKVIASEIDINETRYRVRVLNVIENKSYNRIEVRMKAVE